MKHRIDPSPQLRELAALQSGVLTPDQARGHGLPRSALDRLVGNGSWRRLGRGLYLADDEDPTWSALAWGGVLLGGDLARLGGLAAGHLHGLNDPPAKLTVMVPERRVLTSRDPWVFVQERRGVRVPRTGGDPPRLGLEDTVLDLSEHCDEGELVELVTRALQSGRTTPQKLRRRAAARRRLRHRRLLGELLGDLSAGATNTLELRFLRKVERPHGLPRADRQRVAHYGPYRQDARYDDCDLVVELDGRLFHDGVTAFRDMSRDNAGVVAGKATLRYGWFDVADRACPMAFQIGHVLIGRGWGGVPRRCDDCQQATDSDFW